MFMKFCRLPLTLLLFVVVFFFSSCDTTHRYTYLQQNTGKVISDQEALVKSVQLKSVEYRLKPEDRLEVSIFSLTDEKLNFLKKPEIELRVNEKGQIELPVMGAIVVEGLTVPDAEKKVKQVASEYLRSPEISIKLLNFNVTILGEVFKQGAFNVAESKINILEAIGKAGGVTDNANMETIRIVRNDNDTAKIYKVNMLEDHILASDKYFLQPNDIVIVNPLKAKSSNQQRLTIISLVLSILTSLTWLIR
jgi:polysaccharide export outer membrane protein